MKITIKTIRLDITPALTVYIEKKLAPLAKFLKRFDETGEAEIWLEISRVTRHHKKGGVFGAFADLRLPKRILRAEAFESDIRAAIDAVKDELRREIETYRTRFLEVKRKKL